MADAQAKVAGGQAGFFRRLIVAPESGLVLVIALVMLLLTVFSGSKPVRDFVRPDSGTAVEVVGGADSAATVYRLTVAGKQETFASKDGWEVSGPATNQSVVRSRTANKFLNAENLMQVLVFASFIAIMAVGITAVITMSGIDLSIGSTYALAALAGAIVLRYNFSQGFPQATLHGSHGLWWGALVLGVVLAVGATFAKKSKAVNRADASGVAKALPSAMLWAGVGLVLAVGWQLIGKMHEVGVQQTARSGLSLVQSLPLALAVCCSVGALAGWVNGTLIVGLRVHPFIITLGTMAAYRGLVALPTQAQSVSYFPESFTDGFMKLSVAGGLTPTPVAIMIVVCLAGVFVLSRTVLGRRVYAIGGNEVASAYAGIPVGKVKVAVYTLMGMLSGLAACVYIGYFGAAETAAGTGYELKAIAAAVIGGASLSGGRGSALGAVLGAVLVQLIDNGMVMLGIDQSYNQIVLGAAIIVAVVLDQLKTRLVPLGK